MAALHASTCDLSTIGAPSAALAVLRVAGGNLEWLVLADVTIAIETPDGIRIITDNRVAESIAGLDPHSPRLGEQIGAARAAHRNRPGGYWVAADKPDAAGHAVTGSAPMENVRRVMVLTDGAARLVDLFGSAWEHALEIGPEETVREVRAFEAGDPECSRWPRIKTRDDATAVLWSPAETALAARSHPEQRL